MENPLCGLSSRAGAPALFEGVSMARADPTAGRTRRSVAAFARHGIASTAWVYTCFGVASGGFRILSHSQLFELTARFTR